MFHLSGMVKDKHLSKVMLALDGLMYDLKVQPVRNAEVKSGKVGEKHSAKGAVDAVRSLIKEAANAGKLVITRAELGASMVKTGYRVHNTNQALVPLLEKGIVVRQARGLYHIHPEKL